MWIRTSHSSKRHSDPGGKGIGLTVWWSPYCLSAWDLHQVSLNSFNCEMQIMLHSGKELLMLKWMHELKMISSAVSIISEHIVDTQCFNALFYTQICSVYHFDPPSAKNSYSKPIAHVNQFCQRSRWWATGWRNASSCIIPKLQCLTVGLGRTEPSWEGEVAHFLGVLLGSQHLIRLSKGWQQKEKMGLLPGCSLCQGLGGLRDAGESGLAGRMAHHNAFHSRGANFKLASILFINTENIHSRSKGIGS